MFQDSTRIFYLVSTAHRPIDHSSNLVKWYKEGIDIYILYYVPTVVVVHHVLALITLIVRTHTLSERSRFDTKVSAFRVRCICRPCIESGRVT